MTNKHNITQTVSKMLLIFRRDADIENEKQLWDKLLGHLLPEQKDLLISFRATPYLPDLLEKVIHLLTKASESNKALGPALDRYIQVLTAYVSDCWKSEDRYGSIREWYLSLQDGPEPAYTEGMVTCFFQAEMEDPVPMNVPVAITFMVSREQIAHLTETLAATEKARVLSDQPLSVHCRPVKNFIVIGTDKQEVRVPEKDDPLLLIFNGRCTHQGPCGLAIDVWQGQLLLCTVTLQPVCVGSRTRPGVCSASASGFLMTPLKHPVHQLRITERVEGTGIYYSYYLDSPQLNIFNRYESCRINGNMQQYLKSLHTEMDTLWSTAGGREDDVESLARDIGADLFSSLLPPDLQDTLWANRDQIHSLMLVTEEASIPWELLLIKDPKRKSPLPEDKFLGDMGLIRWLYGWQPTEKFVFNPGRMYCVIPDYKDRNLFLPEAAAERAFLETHLGAQSIPAQLRNVMDLLRPGTGFDLLHFSCHGALDKNTGIVKLVLQDELDGNAIIPSYLPQVSVEASGPFRLPGDFRPMVVLNTCHAGAISNKPVGSGGFANAFLKAGAGGFVGALWSIEDHAAFAFITSWYQSLREGKTLSAATTEARQAAKEKFGVTYLAYTIYGHPDAVLCKR